VKAEATKIMAAHGATSTHHHAVGKLHRPHYEVERGALYGETLMAIKRAHDPVR
jgi:alkyldihydroxyacetonephosphate synthase